MNKLVVRGFIQWLDTATEEEIETRRGEFLAALEHFQGEDQYQSARYVPNLVQTQILMASGMS